MSRSASAAAFVESKPLIGYQLDVSHLHEVLRDLARGQDALGQDVARLANQLGNVERQAQELQRAVQAVRPEQLQQLGQQVDILARATDEMTQRHLPEIRQQCEQNARGLEGAVQPLARAVDDLQRRQEQQQRDVGSAVDQAQRAAGQAQQQAEAAGAAAQRAVGDLEGRVSHLEREAVPAVARDIGELTQRTDDNFRHVEATVQTFDQEIKRAKSDVANVRAELTTVENESNHRLAKAKEDTDAKLAMMLQLMQQFERNAAGFEEGIIQAGRALQQARGPSQPGSVAGGSVAPASAVGGGSGTGSSYRGY